MKTVACYGGAFAVLALLAWGGWHLDRWFNWEFQYRGAVEQTVRDMVKREALK